MADSNVTGGVGKILADSKKAAEEAAAKNMAEIRPQRIRSKITEYFVGPGELPPGSLIEAGTTMPPVPDTAAPDLCRSDLYPNLGESGGIGCE